MKKNTKKRRLLLPVLLLAGGVLVVGGWYLLNAHPKKAANPSVSTETMTKADKLTKPTETTNASGDTTKPTSDSGSTTTQSTSLSVIFSRPVDGDSVAMSDTLAVRSMITGATTGSCSLKLQGPGGSSMTKTASLVAQTSYGSCSFDIPGSQLSAGQWQLSLTATSGNSTSNTATETVTVR